MTSPPELPADPQSALAPRLVMDRLAGSIEPYLIGVRHHSPALSVVIGELLSAFRPDVLLLELPAEFAEWLPWLSHGATTAPVALAGVVGTGGAPAFYPFADFSPELVALRWAAAHGVEVRPCDLPLADRGWHEPPEVTPPEMSPPEMTSEEEAAEVTPVEVTQAGVAAADMSGGAMVSLAGALQDATSGRPDEDMWDRTVEARAPGADPEAIRRAALMVGWALRQDAAGGAGVSALDLRREAWMRRCLGEARGRRVAAVVGSFHASALLDDVERVSTALTPAAASPVIAIPGASGPGASGPMASGPMATGPMATGPMATSPVATSLVPYTFGLLDSRSGYPAGIRDPRWQQAIVQAAGVPAAVEAATIDAVVRICAQVRQAGHPAGPGEAGEAVRLATGLARLRGLPAPGRGELVEALASVLAHGEVLGRGRVVAAAMETVLVGDVRGTLAPGTPRSGLRPAVQELLAELRLPVPGDPARELRLDPLRSDLDRRRDVVLRQLAVCHIGYGEEIAVAGTGGGDALSARWKVAWTPGTDAMLDIAGVRGVTLAQATEGMLRQHRRGEDITGGPSAAHIIDGLAAAAECGLIALTAERLHEFAHAVPATGSLVELISGLALLDRLGRGHIPGVPERVVATLGDLAEVAQALETAAIRQVDGLAGSEAVADAHALLEIARRADASGGGLRLTDCLERLTRTGTPMIAAAALAVGVLSGDIDSATLATRLMSWIDVATGVDGRRHLQSRLTGLLAVAEPLLEAGHGALDGLLDRIEELPDADFVSRLPALRGGFQAISPAGRDRLLAVVESRIGTDEQVHEISAEDAATLLVRLSADRAGRDALIEYGLDSVLDHPVAGSLEPAEPNAVTRDNQHSISTVDRWRLLLGRQSNRLSAGAGRYASALDELYGAGSGEGSRADAAERGGRETPFPGVRAWAEELSDLFGPGIREEVVARAVDAGRRDAAFLLDPDAATPSISLLQTVLSLAGALPEASLARLRPLVARIVADLTRQLASRLRPALAGISTPRPTRRPGGRLDLARTLRANMATTRRGTDGRVQVIPERPVFHTRARRSVDWRLILVVDVSGSMEASVIWSALTAAILAGVPALTTHFLAFSTDIVDLTDRVDDPLGLLLEVKVGGGTHIAAGLHHARSLVTVPTRTLVVVVSDFEEGYPVSGLLAEARALIDAGVTVLGCASLDDQARPRYSVSIASQLVACGVPVAALSPLELARWVAEKVRA